MSGVKLYLSAVLVFLHISKGMMHDFQMQVIPESVLVNVGGEVTFMCKLHERLDTCMFKIRGVGYSMKPGKEKNGIQYRGTGLENGECGIIIPNITEKDNGNITCSMALDTTDPTEYLGHMQIIVAVPPQKPEIEVSSGVAGKHNVHKERESLTATCTARDARPAANISWVWGDQVITEGVGMKTETCTPQARDLCTVQQNFTRTLQVGDDKKTLKCIVTHFALQDKELVAEYQLFVHYPPKPASEPIEHFGLVEGATVRVPVMVEANPKPVIIWNIGGDTIYENDVNGRYMVEPTVEKSPGLYESVLLIDSLTKEDTEKDYKVSANNELGLEHYKVSLSTSPAPKVLEMGAGLIFIIVVAIIVILLILGGVFYARTKGKFCFAGTDSVRNTGESSDTESAEHTADHKPKLSFVSVFKKKSDKVAVDKEMLKNVTVDDEKSENADQPLDPRDPGESVVYAELDLVPHVSGPAVVVRGDDDKTEYAEIIHTQLAPK